MEEDQKLKLSMIVELDNIVDIEQVGLLTQTSEKYWKRHRKGGGWVHDDSKVDKDVYLPPAMVVWDNVVVQGTVDFRGEGIIYQNVSITGENINIRSYVTEICKDVKIQGNNIAIDGSCGYISYGSKIVGNNIHLTGDFGLYQTEICGNNIKASILGNEIINEIIRENRDIYSITIHNKCIIFVPTSMTLYIDHNPYMVKSTDSINDIDTLSNYYKPFWLTPTTESERSDRFAEAIREWISFILKHRQMA